MQSLILDMILTFDYAPERILNTFMYESYDQETQGSHFSSLSNKWNVNILRVIYYNCI